MNKKRDFCKELEKSLIACIQPGEEKHKYYCVDSSDKDKIGTYLEAVSTYYVYLINNGDRDLEVNAANWHQEPKFVKLPVNDKHLIEEYPDWMFDFINDYGILIRVENAGQFRVNFTIDKYIPGDEDMAIVPVLNKKAQILPIEVKPEEQEEKKTAPENCSEADRKICPRCRSIEIIPIQYGLPAPEMVEQHKKGQVKIGGCVVGEDSPRWYCKECNYEF